MVAVGALAFPATAQASATFRVLVTQQSSPDYIIDASYDVLRLECAGSGAAAIVTVNGQIVRVVSGPQVADPANPSNALTGPTMPCADLYGLRATGTAGNDILEILTNAEEPAALQALNVVVDAAAGNDTVDLGARTASPCAPQTERCTTSRRSVSGGEGDDTLIGSTSADGLVGGAGNDVMDAGAGNDVVAGEEGDDSVDGGTGDDRLYGGFVRGDPETGNDVVNGDAGDDRIAAGDGGNTLRGGIGNDLIAADDLDAETRSSWDGGPGNDALAAGAGPAELLGGGGNDRITSRAGANLVRTGIEVDAGAGNDNVDFSRARAGVLVRLGPGQDVAVGGSGGDFLDGEGGNDRLGGNGGRDLLVGRAGNDALSGGDGPDALYGGAGNDALDGGQGVDLLAPGPGTNRLVRVQGDRCVPGNPNPPANPGAVPAAGGFPACQAAASRRRSAPSGT